MQIKKKRLSNGLWIETNRSANDIVRVSKKILDQECNYECFLFMRGIENNNYLENRKLYLNNGDLYVLKSFNIYTVLNEERYFTFDDYLFQITD